MIYLLPTHQTTFTKLRLETGQFLKAQQASKAQGLRLNQYLIRVLQNTHTSRTN